MDRERNIQDKIFAPVIRELDDTFVVWFPNGNQYLRMEEPALFVFRSHGEGLDRDSIVRRCIGRYRIPENECRQFVTDIVDRIEAISQMPVGPAPDHTDGFELRAKPFSPFSIRYYSAYGRSLCFRFGDRLIEQWVHPQLQHLEVDHSRDEPLLFELFGHHDRYVLRVAGRVKGSWCKEESHLLNGMVSLQLVNALYQKDDHDWMAVIHASAVTNGAKTIVFPASPGSGKSTLAALLHQRGFSIVSDDFVPLERISQHVFPFPAALSVKEGSTELLSAFYPSLLKQEKAQSRTNKQVRYLPIAGKAEPAPVKEIVFARYDPAVDFEMERLPRADALGMLLDETWTSPSAENADRFLDWYSGLSCYRLSYSDNEKAMQTITKLFEQ